MDGRDIGTAVFPDAEVKFFLYAGLDERARRRYRELVQAGVSAELEAVRADIARRDKHDSGRKIAPLQKAADAIEIDTTELTINEVVDFVIENVRKR